MHMEYLANRRQMCLRLSLVALCGSASVFVCVCAVCVSVCVWECDSGLACVNISATLCRTQPVVATRSTQLISVSQRQLKCPRWTGQQRMRRGNFPRARVASVLANIKNETKTNIKHQKLSERVNSKRSRVEKKC